MKLKPYEKSGLYRAIVALGGVSKMAIALTSATGKPVSRQTVFQWRRYGRVPQWFVMPIHNLTLIPLTELLEEYAPLESETADDN